MQHHGTAGKHLTLHPSMDFQALIIAELSPLTSNYFREFFLILPWHVGRLHLAASLMRKKGGFRLAAGAILNLLN